ncbi:MAG TPA: hypothetical protein VF147_08315 [Vicinamibacterales bacterium]
MIVSPTLLACVVVAQSAWSMSAGSEKLSFRDISRSGPPADASPVAWESTGPSFAAAYTREGVRRFHRVTADLARASSFEYAGPVNSTVAPGGDRALRLEGRYEYRRYFLDDLFTRGLDVGVGVQGMGRRLSLTRSTSTAEHVQADTSAAVGATVAARWHRSPRWTAEVAWINGGAALHETESQDGARAFEHSQWGGAWFTDLSMRVSVRLASPWWLSAEYLATGEGTATDHDSFALDRRRFIVGVTHAR